MRILHHTILQYIIMEHTEKLKLVKKHITFQTDLNTTTFVYINIYNIHFYNIQTEKST